MLSFSLYPFKGFGVPDIYDDLIAQGTNYLAPSQVFNILGMNIAERSAYSFHSLLFALFAAQGI